MGQVFVVKSLALTPQEEHEDLAPYPWHKLPLYGYKRRMRNIGIRNIVFGIILLMVPVGHIVYDEITSIPTTSICGAEDVHCQSIHNDK